MRRLLREQEEAGALPAALTISRDAESRCQPGTSSRLEIGTVVQLHLRVAIGLQALQRCSGLLNRRARGSTVATHHFTPAWLSSDSSSFVNCRANRPTRVRVSPLAPELIAPVAQSSERDASNVGDAGESPAGSAIFAALAQLQEALRSGRRGWGWKSLTRHQLWPCASSPRSPTQRRRT